MGLTLGRYGNENYFTLMYGSLPSQDYFPESPLHVIKKRCGFEENLTSIPVHFDTQFRKQHLRFGAEEIWTLTPAPDSYYN